MILQIREYRVVARQLDADDFADQIEIGNEDWL